jgi:nucleoside-diphosphate-sugar epimerase
MMHVLVAGGAGYVGSRLVPELLNKGYKVTVYDLYLYGDVFKDIQNNENLRQIKADIRDFQKVEESLSGVDFVIHLACISNDPSFELNPELGKSINLSAFEPFVELAKKAKVKRFIYASSSSVYGVKSEPNVTEDMDLEPLTDYSKFKADCEKILFMHQSNDFICTVLRPATVCGFAPRQRLDLVVNILVNHAYHNGKIKVIGGNQLRPNIHIEDMVRAYIHVLEMPDNKIQGEIFNVGYHNHSVNDLALIVEKIISKKRPVELVVEPTNDHRSYHVSSQKIYEKLNFAPKHTIEDAVEDLLSAFEKGLLTDSLENKLYFNIKMMKAVNLE